MIIIRSINGTNRCRVKAMLSHRKCARLSRIKCEKLWQFHGAARADPVIKYALFDAESDLRQSAICSSAALTLFIVKL